MKEMIEKIEALIAENKAIKERTPQLDVALGGLLTARDNLTWHVKVTTPKPAAK